MSSEKPPKPSLIFEVYEELFDEPIILNERLDAATAYFNPDKPELRTVARDFLQACADILNDEDIRLLRVVNDIPSAGLSKVWEVEITKFNQDLGREETYHLILKLIQPSQQPRFHNTLALQSIFSAHFSSVAIQDPPADVDLVFPQTYSLSISPGKLPPAVVTKLMELGIPYQENTLDLSYTLIEKIPARSNAPTELKFRQIASFTDWLRSHNTVLTDGKSDNFISLFSEALAIIDSGEFVAKNAALNIDSGGEAYTLIRPNIPQAVLLGQGGKPKWTVENAYTFASRTVVMEVFLKFVPHVTHFLEISPEVDMQLMQYAFKITPEQANDEWESETAKALVLKLTKALEGKARNPESLANTFIEAFIKAGTVPCADLISNLYATQK